MCFNIAVYREKKLVEHAFNARFLQPELYQPYYHVSGFSLPYVPVITSEDPGVISMYRWGLVPFWVRSASDADDICRKTLNARGETIDVKPSFRAAARKRRCTVLVDGFYEWSLTNDRKYPYYIRRKDGDMITLAGLWENWEQDKSILNTFTIITREADAFFSKVHYPKNRMPVILDEKNRAQWLDPQMNIARMKQLIQMPSGIGLTAHTVDRRIASGKPEHEPQILSFIDYGLDGKNKIESICN